MLSSCSHSARTSNSKLFSVAWGTSVICTSGSDCSVVTSVASLSSYAVSNQFTSCALAALAWISSVVRFARVVDGFHTCVIYS